jgi:Tol biopolymer transport system component
LLRNVRDTRDAEKALEILTGLDIEDIDRDFRRYYRKLYDGTLKGRTFPENSALGLTRHLREQSSLNIAPAVSPDGTKIAFISNRDVYPRLAVARLDDLQQVRYLRTIAGGDISSLYEGFGFFSNTISWSPDGRNLVFAAQSHGREKVFYCGLLERGYCPHTGITIQQYP